MRTLLLLAYLALCVGIGHRIAPFWKDDVSVWGRTVAVAPHHARAMVNLADAYARGSLGTMNTVGAPPSSARIVRWPPTEPELRLALFWAASARQHAKYDGLLPERERRTVIMAADSNMVSILLGWPTSKMGTYVVPQPPDPATMLRYVDEKSLRTEWITFLLEEIWQLQSASSPK